MSELAKGWHGWYLQINPLGDVPINESYLMSIRMTKSKKVSSGIWGVEHKVLVSVKGTNHVA